MTYSRLEKYTPIKMRNNIRGHYSLCGLLGYVVHDTTGVDGVIVRLFGGRSRVNVPRSWFDVVDFDEHFCS